MVSSCGIFAVAIRVIDDGFSGVPDTVAVGVYVLDFCICVKVRDRAGYEGLVGLIDVVIVRIVHYSLSWIPEAVPISVEIF